MSRTDIRPARRLDGFREYWFSEKLREVARMNACGLDVVSLGIGGPDLPPHASVVDVLCDCAHRPDVHGYQPHKGLDALRGAVALWYGRTYGVELDPDTMVLPLIGSKEGILHISLAFTDPGDEVLVPDPGYMAYGAVARMTGAVPVAYPLTEDGGWLPDFDALERCDLSRVRLMWINYPHMPTGTAATEELFRRVVDFGRRHSILIVNDNPYSLILNDGRPLSILAAEGAADVALEMNSLSKSHNMAGWRMGMVCGAPRYITAVLKVKSNIDSGQYRPMMEAAARALALGDDWRRDVDAEYRRRRSAAAAVMDALGCRFDERQTGLFLWGRIPDGEASSEQMAERVLRQARVFITPGSIFGAGGARYMRISLCAPVERLEEARRRIEAMKDGLCNQ